MKWIIKIWGTVAIVLGMSGLAVSASDSARLLQGAKTLTMVIKVYDVKGCEISRLLVDELQKRFIQSNDKLRIVPEDNIPDLHATLLLETSVNQHDDGEQFCAFLSNLRVIHPMYGTFRYRQEPNLIQALVFNKSIFGSSTPPRLETDTKKQIEMLLDIFYDTLKAYNAKDNDNEIILRK